MTFFPARMTICSTGVFTCTEHVISNQKGRLKRDGPCTTHVLGPLLSNFNSLLELRGLGRFRTANARPLDYQIFTTFTLLS